MSVLGSLFAATTVSYSDFVNPAKWLNDWGIMGPYGGDGPVNETEANAIPAFWACVRNISEDVAKLPIFTYERLPDRRDGRSGGRRKLRDHPSYRLLRVQPNEFQTSHKLREDLARDTVVSGNGYALIDRANDGTPEALSYIHPTNITPVSDGEDGIAYILRGPNGEADFLVGNEDMIHVRGIGTGPIGLSVLGAHMLTLGISLDTQKTAGALFRNGIRPSGILKYTKALGEDALKRLKQDWKEAHADAENKFKLIALEEGFDYEQLTIAPEEAQFLETRKFEVVEICRIFRMPPHKVQHLDNATFSNITEQNTEYVVDCLHPWLVRHESEYIRKLVSQEDRDEESVYIEHLVAGLLRGDTASRASFYQVLFDRGVINQNEIRELENMNPIGEDGDDYWVPLNMQRLGEKVEEPDEPTTQAPAPTEEEDDQGDEDEQEDAGGQDEEETDEDDARATALIPVVRSAFRVAAAREEKALTRAAKRYADDSTGRLAWATKFYAEHERFLIDVLAPAHESIALLVGLDVEAASYDVVSKQCVSRINEIEMGASLEKLARAAVDQAEAAAGAWYSIVFDARR